MIVLLDENPQQMDYAIPGGLTLNMADGWVLQQLIATASYTAKKIDNNEKVMVAVKWRQEKQTKKHVY